MEPPQAFNHACYMHVLRSRHTHSIAATIHTGKTKLTTYHSLVLLSLTHQP